MKFNFFFLYTVLFSVICSAQSLEEKAAGEFCEKISTYEDFQQARNYTRDLLKQIRLKYKVTDEKFTDILMDNCEHYRSLLVEEKRARYYREGEDPLDDIYVNSLLRNGSKLIENGEYDEAIITIKKILPSDEMNVKALNLIGYCYYEKNDYTSAIKYYDKVLSIFDADYQALKEGGISYGMLGKVDSAMNNFKNLVYYYPEDYMGHLLLSYSFNLQGNYGSAIEHAFFASKCPHDNQVDFEILKKYTKEIIQKLKAGGREDLVIEMAKKYDIVLEDYSKP